MTNLNNDCDLTFVLRSLDDEEHVGHTIARLAAHLRGMDLRYELLVVDEGSGDNTLAIAALLRKQHPELETLHATPGRGYVVGAGRARGRMVVLADVRDESPLSLLGYALSRAERGADVISVGGRLVMFRRTRALRALESLTTVRRSSAPVRFLRRARTLGLRVAELHPRHDGLLARLADRLRYALAVPRVFLPSTRL
ncbi:MAG: glycosyltransferase [Polyangia bacterium]